MLDEIYRFRPISALLDDYKELEKQEIYFAPSEHLNDPLEGYRDIFWQGDKIVWTNLIRHYTLCLTDMCLRYLVAGDDIKLYSTNIPILLTEKMMLTLGYKDLHHEVFERVIELKIIAKTIEVLLVRNTQIRRNELTERLRTVHTSILKIIFEVFFKKGFCSENVEFKGLDVSHVDKLYTLISEIPSFVGDESSDMMSVMSDISERMTEQMNLINLYKEEICVPNKKLIIQDFPKHYMKEIEKLVYPEWYTACFMSEYKNSSVWGHYGSNHSGACLIFNVNNNRINIKGLTGTSSAGRNMELYKVDYKSELEAIDFFKTLGRLPTGELRKNWYQDEDGNLSSCAEVFKNEDKWRREYWENFYRDITKKTHEWEYEKEYRLILDNTFYCYEQKEQRLLRYDFSYLKGIVFGINTEETDKVKIMKIIDKKCQVENRTDFKYYQAYYDHKNKCIEKYELTLLKKVHAR